MSSEKSINNEKKFDDSQLPLSVQGLIRICKRIIVMARRGECNDDDAAAFIAKASPIIYGFVREDQFVSADESMRILELNQNRNKFFELIKRHKIKSHTFKGVKIGYKRDDIYKLKYIIENGKENNGSYKRK
ncbi:MAG: hypothetical protein ACI4N3_04120 [Alphaproteobacteria bacterium]